MFSDVDESSSDDEGGEVAEHNETLRGGAFEDEEEAAKKDALYPRDIHAHWIQRSLAKFLNDPIVAQQKVTEVFNILKDSTDDRECENKLVLLLGFDHFDFIRILRQHRNMVLYCTLLKQAAVPLASLPFIIETERAKREKTAQRRAIAAAGEEAVAAGQWLAGRKVLDLEDLAFSQGSHLMSNKRCELPDGSYRKQKKSWEEIHVPALKPRPFAEGEKLIDISELPKWAQPAFDGFKSLNRIQSRLCESASNSDEHLLICAPTGGGKTNVALLTILHEIGKHLNEDGSVEIDEFKCIYIAPMKSLVQVDVATFLRVKLDHLFYFDNSYSEFVQSIDKRNYSFEPLYGLNQHELGKLIRMPKMGKPLYKFIRQVCTFIILFVCYCLSQAIIAYA